MENVKYEAPALVVVDMEESVKQGDDNNKGNSKPVG